MVSVHDKEELKIFLDELNENLNFLDDSIISLEKNPGDPETLEDIFRVAHTIKGSAGFLDLKNLVSLGHAMENVFQEFKSGGVQVDKEVIDTLLECKDAIAQIGNLLGKGEDSGRINTENLITKVNLFLQKSKSSGKDNETAEIKPNTNYNHIANDEKLLPEDCIPGALLVRVFISQSELAPSIRAFLVQKRLSEHGEIVQQKPSEDEMDAEDFELPQNREIRYWIKTESPIEEIESAAKADLIDKVSVLPEEILKAMISFSGKEGPETDQGQKMEVETSDSVRIPVQSLDFLLNLVGELVIANSGFTQIQDTLRNFPDLQNVLKDVRDRSKDLVRISSEIQGLVMNSRLVPISQVFNRFRRFVRDYSSKSGKKINLAMVGESTELDKKITDEIIKPLTHLVRNSLDHGLETVEERLAAGKTDTGTLHLEAYQEGNYINIIIKDDGRGLNTEKIIQKAIEKNIITAEEALRLSENDVKNLIFNSGFSTKEEVDEMSGRGVGMDVVKSSVEELNGTIIVDSIRNQGTAITIKLPLTLAILNALIVQVGKEKYCIPMSVILETQKVNIKNFLTVDNNEMVRLRDKLIPVIRLDKVFPSLSNENIVDENTKINELNKSRLRVDDDIPVIVVDYHNSHIGILVDKFLSRQEVVIKSLAEHYRTIDGISGASILGDGSIILIIDVHGVIQLFKTQRSKAFGEVNVISPMTKQSVKTLTQEKPSEKPVVQPEKKITVKKEEKPQTKPEVKPSIKPDVKEKETVKKKFELTDISSISPEEFEKLEDLDIENLPKENEEIAQLPEQVENIKTEDQFDQDMVIYPDSPKEEQPSFEPEETELSQKTPEIQDTEVTEKAVADVEQDDTEDESFSDMDIGIFEDETTDVVVANETGTTETISTEPDSEIKFVDEKESTPVDEEIEIYDEPSNVDLSNSILNDADENIVEDKKMEILTPEDDIITLEKVNEPVIDFHEKDFNEHIIEGIDLHDTDEELLREKSKIDHFDAESHGEENIRDLDKSDDISISIVDDSENINPEINDEADSYEFSVSEDDSVIIKNKDGIIEGSTEQRLMDQVPEEVSVYDEQPERLATSPSQEITIEEIEKEMIEMENIESNQNVEPVPEEKPETTSENAPNEISEFERMKMMIESGEMDENSNLYQSIALNHFNRDDYQMDKLYDLLDGKNPEMVKTWLKTGNERAIEGIKSLTGRTNIFPGQTRAKKYSRDKLNSFIDRFRGDDLPVVGLALPIMPIYGMIYFILTHRNAQNMAAMLYQTAQMQAPEVIDFEPLMEVTNILGSAFTNSLTQITDIPIEPGIPEILENNELLVESMNEHLKKTEEKSILYIENEFLWGEKEVLAELIMMIPKVI